MPKQTEKYPDTYSNPSWLNTPDALEELDFEPTCVVQTITVWMQMLGQGPKQCGHPARWVGFSPCCGTPVLVCEEHRVSPMPFSCQPCDKSFPDLINWARL